MKSDKWVILDAREVDGRVVLTPHSSFDLERVQKRMKNGRGEIRASLASIRSLPQLRLYWPWVRTVVEHSDHFTSEDGLHKMLLAACGVVETFIDIEGNITLMPSSIAFDAMHQEDFDAYFNRAQQIVSESILPDYDLEALMQETKRECGWNQMSNPKPRRSSRAASDPGTSPSSSDIGSTSRTDSKPSTRSSSSTSRAASATPSCEGSASKLAA